MSEGRRCVDKEQGFTFQAVFPVDVILSQTPPCIIFLTQYVDRSKGAWYSISHEFRSLGIPSLLLTNILVILASRDRKLGLLNKWVELNLHSCCH